MKSIEEKKKEIKQAREFIESETSKLYGAKEVELGDGLLIERNDDSEGVSFTLSDSSLYVEVTSILMSLEQLRTMVEYYAPIFSDEGKYER